MRGDRDCGEASRIKTAEGSSSAAGGWCGPLLGGGTQEEPQTGRSGRTSRWVASNPPVLPTVDTMDSPPCRARAPPSSLSAAGGTPPPPPQLCASCSWASVEHFLSGLLAAGLWPPHRDGRLEQLGLQPDTEAAAHRKEDTEEDCEER